MTRKIFLFSLVLLATACAPKVQNRQFETPKTDFGPRFGDVDLQQGISPSDNFKASWSWQGEVSSADLFRQSENLMDLGTLLESPALTRKGIDWVEKFYVTENATTLIPFAESPYISAAAGQTKKDVVDAVGDIRQDISKARELIQNKITQLTKAFPWPKKSAPLAQDLQTAQNFLKQFQTALPRLGLSSLVLTNLQEALQKQTKDLLAQAQSLIQKFYAAKKFSQALNVVDGVIRQYKVALPRDLQKTFSAGKQIGQELDLYADEQGALTVLIDVWKMLDTNERVQYFKPVNADLYDFLKNQDDKDLNCLRQRGCSGGFFNGIKKKLFVLPRIKNYGLENLRAQLNQKALTYVVSTVEDMGRGYLPQLPGLLAAQIDAGLVDNDKQLKDIQGNYLSFLQDLVGGWSKKTLVGTQGKIAGFENPRVNLSLNDKTALKLQATGDLAQVSMETTGTAFAAVGKVYRQDSVSNDFVFKTALSQLSKMLALGGYWNDQGNLAPAFFESFSGPDHLLDLMSFTSSSDTYAAPDLVPVTKAFTPATPTKKNFSAKSLAEQVRGLSSLLRFTGDWQKSKFDSVLSPIQAQDITSEYQAEALKRPFFPKDTLVALNLGDVAVLLKNITKEFSQVFLLNTENKLIWANDYDFNGSDTAVMAGAVDIINGRRGSLVKSEDVSRLILAVAEFLEATEGIENTKSIYLTEADSTGRTPLTALAEGRHDLRLLTLALANFISNQLVTPNGLVAVDYDMTSLSARKTARVQDQALAIQALLKAREVTHVDIYLWTAQEIYFSMNRNLFNRAQHFYVNSDQSAAAFPDKLTTLRALVELRPYLPVSSQTQLTWVLQPWLKALTSLP